MIRRILIALSALILAACTPELIPRPVTPPPTVPSATNTPISLNGPMVTSPGLTSIHMFDDKNGWGITDSAVLRTTDGGTTWYSLTPPNATKLGYLVSSSFLDEQHAWILVPDQSDMLKGTLFSTTDGGNAWDSVQVPFGGGVLQFLDAKHGWMLASLGAGAGSMGVAVFRTGDAGATWTQTYTNDPNQPNAGNSLPLGGLKDGLSPIDMQNAWVGGVIYTPGVIYLYRTADGGASWQQASVKTPDGYDQAELETRGPTFTTSNTAFLPVSVASQNGVMMAIYISRDGGTSWLLTPTMIPQGGAMDFVSAKDGYVWNGSTFYVTHDGAQTWATVSPDVTFGDSFGGMDFVNPNTGFVLTSDASGAHGLYVTNDGGKTWNVLGQ